MEVGRKGMEGTGNIQMVGKNHLGLNPGSTTGWRTLGRHYFSCLSLGVLIRKMGMLLAPTCYEDQMSESMNSFKVST